MATRIEKIFKSDTILTMNDILNEINELVEKQQSKRTNIKEWVAMTQRIAKSICGFYNKNFITDEQIQRACAERKN